MVDRHATEIVAGLQTALPQLPKQDLVTTGHDAALAVIGLMDRTATTIDPTALVTLYAGTSGGTSHAVIDQLWTAFGNPTIAVMADGTRTLATLWESAWKQGEGDTRIPAKNLTGIPLSDLQTLYENNQFAPSLDLDTIATVLY